MTVRFYSSIAQPTTLTASITAGSTNISVASAAGFPGATPFTLALDYGELNEELVDVTMIAGLNLTVTRAVDGTSATGHNTGAVVRHVSSARDFSDSRTHEESTFNVHGVTGVGNNLVGTLSVQTLSNKTLDRATGTLERVDIFNTGNWTTTVIGDSANPAFDRLRILDNEINLDTMAAFNSVGALLSVKRVAETDGTYRVRVTDSDGTTDRAAILAGGTMQLTPTATTTFVPVDIIAPDTSTTKRAVRLAAAGGGTERLTVWNDGRMDIVGTNTGFSVLDVTGPAAHASFFMRVIDNGGNALMSVNSDGSVQANNNLDARAVNGGGEVPLRVFANNPGPQTVDLTQWVDQTNTIVSRVTNTGEFRTTAVGQKLWARKSSDTTRSNTTTTTADPALQVTVQANAVYKIDAYVIYNSSTVADFAMEFATPAGATGSWSAVGWGRGAGAGVGIDGYTVRMNDNAITQERTYGGDGTDILLHVKGLLVTAGTAGTLSINWAQEVAEVSNTIVRTDSHLYLERME